MHALCTWWLLDETNVLTGVVKSSSSIGCVGAESNAPVDSNAEEPTRPCTSGIDCFGAEDGTSVESSTTSSAPQNEIASYSYMYNVSNLNEIFYGLTLAPLSSYTFQDAKGQTREYPSLQV